MIGGYNGNNNLAELADYATFVGEEHKIFHVQRSFREQKHRFYAAAMLEIHFGCRSEKDGTANAAKQD
jgi:hypothetical protein